MKNIRAYFKLSMILFLIISALIFSSCAETNKLNQNLKLIRENKIFDSIPRIYFSTENYLDVSYVGQVFNSTNRKRFTPVDKMFIETRRLIYRSAKDYGFKVGGEDNYDILVKAQISYTPSVENRHISYLQANDREDKDNPLYYHVSILLDYYNKFGILLFSTKQYERIELFDTIEHRTKIASGIILGKLYDQLRNQLSNIAFIQNSKLIKEEQFLDVSNYPDLRIITWTRHECENDTMEISDNPFESIHQIVQKSADSYLQPRTTISIIEKIPELIAKPIIPLMPKLVKTQFETQKMFEERVAKVINKRQKQIEQLQVIYRNDVIERNAMIESLENQYNEDIISIKEEQKIKLEKIDDKLLEFTTKALYSVMGNPILSNPTYNAETQTMYADFKATNNNFNKRVSFQVPLNLSESIYKSIDQLYTFAFFSLNENSLRLEKIKTVYNDESFEINLTDEIFEPEFQQYIIEDQKVDFTASEQNNLKLQNPNLIDKYQVKAFAYSESGVVSNKNYIDDLTPLVAKLPQKEIDPTKWLFIIGVENYDETDPVIYSQNSSELFKQVAQKKFGIKEINTYALIENDATSGKIKDKLQRLINKVKEGDQIFFFYSGHGVPIPATKESYILPKDKVVDFIAQEEVFNLSLIYKRLSESNASKVFAFIDACFSGRTDNQTLFKGTAVGLITPKKIKFNENKMVILTAGKDNQFSNSFDEKGHRMFSYYLIKSMLERDNFDLNLIYKDVSVKVHDSSNEKGDVYIQEPQIYGNTALGIK